MELEDYKHGVPAETPEKNQHAWLGFTAIGIITAVCTFVNLVWLRMPQLMYSAIPIILIVLVAMIRVQIARSVTPQEDEDGSV